jgi:hypothetical protein
MRRLFVFLMLNVLVLLSVIPSYCQSILLLKWIKGYSYQEFAEPYQTSNPKDEFYIFTPSRMYKCMPKLNVIVPWANELNFLGETTEGVVYYKKTSLNGNTGIFSIFPKKRIVVETGALINPLDQKMQVSVDYYQVIQVMTIDEFKQNYRIK